MFTAPAISWTRVVSDSTWGFGVTTGEDGVIYFIGSKTLNNGFTDIFISRYSAEGTVSWTQLLGTQGGVSYASGIATSPDGSIYVTGQINRPFDNQIHSGGFDVFLTCYAKDGTKSWSRLLGGDGQDVPFGIAAASDGSIYIAGYTTSAVLDGVRTTGSNDSFLTRYNADGTREWTRLLAIARENIAFGVATSSDGAIYVTGYSNNFNGVVDAYITRYNSDGTKAWTQTLGGTSMDVSKGVTTGVDGAIYIVGYTLSVNIDGQLNNGNQDAFISRYNNDGTKAWTRTFGSAGYDQAYSVKSGSNGRIYVVGETTGELYGQSNQGNGDAFVACYSNDGTKLWTKLWGGSGWDQADDVAVGVDGAIYITGTTAVPLLERPGNLEAFLVKLEPNHLPTGEVNINGIAKTNQTLTASNTLADVDGLGTVSYQWLANGISISGATGASLSLGQAQVGKAISVTASYTDGFGNFESVSSKSITIEQVLVNVAVSQAQVMEGGDLVYTFTRTGDLSAALTVNLGVGGTATATDYTSTLALSGSGSPTVQWTQLVGGSGDDYGHSVAIGADGAVCIAGTNFSPLDGRDGFVTKYTADGTKAWTRQAGGAGVEEGYSVAIGADGSVYIAGYTSSSPLDGQTSNGGVDGYVTKYTADGIKVWTRLAGGADNDDVRSVAIGANGSVYIAGYTSSGSIDGQTSNGGVDGFVTKYAADGTKAWTRLAGGAGNDYGHSVATGADGSVYIAGYTNSGTIDGQAGNGGMDGFVTKYTADGTKAWTRLAGGTGEDNGSSVAIGADGSVYIAGYTNGGSIDGQANNGGVDGFVTKYTADGTKAWTRLAGGAGEDWGHSVATGTDGSVYIAGYTTSGSIDSQAVNGGGDGFVTKYKADGTKAWTRLAGGASYDLGNSVATGADGSVYVAGYTYSNSIDGQTSNGGVDGFVTKFSGTAQPQVTFSAGSSTATLTVHATADQVAESPETLAVSVVAGASYTLGSTAVATGTIVDVPVNNPHTGTVIISGTAKLGQTLTATNTLADVDGMGTISYQWFTGGQAIAGANQSSFTITQAQLGKALSVVASYTDGGGRAESVTSNAPVQVVNYNTAAAENTTAVTTLALTDAALGTAPKFTLIGADAKLFKISNKGVLIFATAKDYEQPVEANHDGVYEVSVVMTNTKTHSTVTKDLTVGVEFTPLVGTTGADTLKGTAGYDTLDGLAGDDKLTGGTGLDTFLVTSGHDTILDFNALSKGATGSEILQVSAGATADATLKAAWAATSDSFNDGIANLTTKGMALDLTGITHGQGWNVTNAGAGTTIKGSQFNDVLTGGAGNDILFGGAGNDLLIGGKGYDILTGGAGADTFRLSGDTKTDHITDFLSGTDRIELDHLLYKALGTGPLAANQFAQGNAATTTTQRIVYDQPTGNLWYDADGSGKGKAVLIGVMDNHVHITNSDFWIV